MNLTPLKELEPTPDEVARVRAGAAAVPERHTRRRRRPALALAAVTAATAGAFALPSGSPTASSALRAAAAAAAEQPGPADFTGYRYVELLQRQSAPWATHDPRCAGDIPPAGSGQPPFDCPETGRVTYTQETRLERWVDANHEGTVVDHGTRVVDVTGDPDLAAVIRREFTQPGGRYPFEYGDGPFSEVPLEELPTDPSQLHAVLQAAYADGRWSGDGRFRPVDGSADARRLELARSTVRLLAEANATPELRSAAFAMLARMDGVTDLGERDGGHAIRIAGRAGGGEWDVPAQITLTFDPDEGDVLAWSEITDGRSTEWKILRSEHVRTKP